MAIVVGEPTYASDVLALLPATYTKITTENRASTTTYADDAELAGIPLTVGTWEIDCLLYWFTAASGLQKIKTTWGFTGTWAAVIRQCVGPGQANTAAADSLTSMNFRGQRENGDAIYETSASGSYSGIRETTRTAVVTVAGNFSLKWAQAVSSASATSVAGQSTVTVRRIGN